jgi:hypothetical protein
MKTFQSVKFDLKQCREELDKFRTLLNSKVELLEKDDLRPFFRDSPQLTAFLGSIFPTLSPANQLAYEFPIFGDFAADIVIGNAGRRVYCAIELEDASEASVFLTRGKKSTKEWGRRFEHGFSQLVDWFFSFDDHVKTDALARHFGREHIVFFGMLLIGRSSHLSDHEHQRLKWRADRVLVNSHKIVCRTYDELYADLESNWDSLASSAGFSR